MSGKSINFDYKKINKSNFCKNQKLFNVYDLDVNKILVSKKESYGTKNSLKYLIAYNDDDVIRPLCIKFPQMLNTLIVIKHVFNPYSAHCFLKFLKKRRKFLDGKNLTCFTCNLVQNLMNLVLSSKSVRKWPNHG